MSPVRFLKGQFEVWSLGLPFTAISVHNWRREILICEKVWSWSWRILNILLIQWWFWKSNKKLTFEAVKLSTVRWCWAMDAFRSWGFPFPLKDFLEPIYFPWPFKGRSLSHLWSRHYLHCSMIMYHSVPVFFLSSLSLRLKSQNLFWRTIKPWSGQKASLQMVNRYILSLSNTLYSFAFHLRVHPHWWQQDTLQGADHQEQIGVSVLTRTGWHADRKSWGSNC